MAKRILVRPFSLPVAVNGSGPMGLVLIGRQWGDFLFDFLW